MTHDTNLTKKIKQCLDVNVTPLYESSNVKAYEVTNNNGSFTVVDYKDRFSSSRDTEIYYSRYTDPVSKNTSEFKLADQAVSDYIKQTLKK